MSGELRTGPVKGWKVFDENLKCRNMQYAIGKSFEVAGDLVICQNGLHFHEHGHHIFNYYDNSLKNRVCEVAAFDVISDDDKSVCRRLEVVRELGLFEVCSLIGDGYGDGDGDGDGDGNGNGNGNGNGYGDGNGYGNGYGNGNGDGYGNGYGNGNGDGYGKYKLPDFIKFENEDAA